MFSVKSLPCRSFIWVLSGADVPSEGAASSQARHVVLQPCITSRLPPMACRCARPRRFVTWASLRQSRSAATSSASFFRRGQRRLEPLNAISAPGASNRSRRAVPHRGAKETVPPAERWLARSFPGSSSPLARQLAVMPAPSCDGPGGCVHVLCHRALPGGAIDLGIY
jgi:hypothetical protein